jgi:hypothetical protein
MFSRTRSALIVASLACAAIAVADEQKVIEFMVANESGAHGSFDVIFDPGKWQGGQYSWSLDTDHEIWSTDGKTLLATLQKGSRENGTWIELFDGQGGRANPTINLGFAMQAGSEKTTFTVRSALLKFGPFGSAQARASAAFSVTDGLDGDGGLLEGLGRGQGGGGYLAQYNGFVPAGTDFAQLIDRLAIPADGSDSKSEAKGPGFTFEPIGYAEDMSAQVSFTITKNDLASGTSLYEIAPEPASLILLAVGVCLFRRR